MSLDDVHRELFAHLLAARTETGGFGYIAGQTAEPEPTAVAALALGDDQSREALRAQPLGPAPPALALAALALGDGRLLAAAVAQRARTIGESGGEDGDERRAWGWTPETYSWVEPTSWVLLAAKRLGPDDPTVVAEAEAVLAERQCDDGGWNYGNATTQGVDLRGYVQTTAVALTALQGQPGAVTARGLRFLLEKWPSERGGLSLAQAAVAVRLAGAPDDVLADIIAALAAAYRRTRFLGDVHALAWAVLASAPAEHLDATLRATR